MSEDRAPYGGQERVPPAWPLADPREIHRRETGERARDATGRRPRRQDEKELHWRIYQALRELGCDVTSTAQPHQAHLSPGIPDLYVRHARWGVRVWLEVKTPEGQVSPAQRAWHEVEASAGGRVHVVRSLSEALRVLREAVAPITL